MTYTAFGKYDQKKAGHPEIYFAERHTMIDYRGDLQISPLSNWGWANTIITASHDIFGGQFSSKLVKKPVVVEDYAWITSRCILYNCTIRHHGIVAIGSVVAGMIVEPYTVVMGNPAKVIAHWDGKHWIKEVVSMPM